MARLGTGDDNQFKSMQKRLREMRTPIVEKCIGCKKIDIKEGVEPSSFDLCSAYISPEKTWRKGNCPLATHTHIEEKPKEKVRVGQQKSKSMK